LHLKRQEEFFYLEFPNLAAFPGIQHRVFTRHGGYSTGPYKSLNVSFGVGDDNGLVKRNRDVISGHLKSSDVIFARQNHGTGILSIKSDADTPGNARAGNPPAVDALVTNIRNKFLVIQVADCQAVLLYDPVNEVVANVHCGWRGSVQNILGGTLKKMKKDFGCSPSDMAVGIGPSLGPCCSEFVNYRDEIPEKLWGHRVGEDHFDFWAISVEQLTELGVCEENISRSRQCTKCRTDRYFSYRGEKTTGRFAVVIGLV